MTDDIYQAAEVAFGSFPQPEPYIGMKMKTGKKFNGTHDKVYRLYRLHKDIVNDEMWLISEVWEEESFIKHYEIGGLLFALKKVTHPETISRRRRELHEAGLIEYSPKAMKTRTEAFKSERNKASPMSPQIKLKAMNLRFEKYNDLDVSRVSYEQTRLV